MVKNLKQYLNQYFNGLNIPKMSSDEGRILAEEITRMVETLEKNPDISYSDLWDKIHE
ncbi:MAG: hypothetical protein ABSB18_07350 [Candidatus Omnitrophota bacterium]